MCQLLYNQRTHQQHTTCCSSHALAAPLLPSHPQISHHEYFSANPDRRRRLYSTPAGIYQAGCGLKNVYMSWGAPEYLYMMLVLNQVALPEEALFILR
jgi:hypothetical protein